MNYIISPPPQVSVAIRDRDSRFPVRRVYCVGRNYEAHAREMGKDPSREPPFLFQKPADAVVENGSLIGYPPQTNNFHHEIELVVAIGRGGSDISVTQAIEHVLGYAVGVDLTRRDQQLAARDAGRPWEWGKAFDRSAPCSAIALAEAIGHPAQGRIWLTVNDTLRQEADINQLIWSVPEVIAFISSSMVLEAGDLIFTGTPAGVGPLVPGDVVAGGVEGVGTVSIRIGPAAHRMT
jgi:fumarylpyruvate hydrolase